MRHAARTDKNQPEIMDALRKVGVQVYHLKRPFDLLICVQGRTELLECKTADGRFTKGQLDFLAMWPGTVHVVRSPEEAVRAVLRLEAA